MSCGLDSFLNVLVFAGNHSASPPGGNQVDGLPPALRLQICFANFDFSKGFWGHGFCLMKLNRKTNL